MAAQQSSRVLNTTSKVTSKKGEEVEMGWVVTYFETPTRSTKDLSFPFTAGSTLGFDAEWELRCNPSLSSRALVLFLKRVSGSGNNIPLVAKLEIQINPVGKDCTKLCLSSDIYVRTMIDKYKSLCIKGITIGDSVYQDCSYSVFTFISLNHHVLDNGGFIIHLKFNLKAETITTKVDDTNTIASTLVECIQIQKAKLLALLESGDGSDVILKTADGHDIPVHKSILFAHSDVFKAMFANDMKEKQCGIVDLEDIGVDALKIFLKFLYTGDIDLNWGDHYEEIINAAEKYQVAIVRTLCDNLLGNLCTKENCIQLFKVANLHGLCTAKKRIEKFLLGNPELLLQHVIKST